MSGEKSGVQFLIRQIYPNTLFIHCYAHQLNLVLLHGAKTIKSVKLFICNLTMFITFFSRSTKRNLKNAVLHVTEEPGWDPISVCTASGLYDKLNDANFVYFLILFGKVFLYTDHVFKFLQLKSLSNIKSCIFEIQNLKKNLTDLRNDTNVNNYCDEAILLNNNLEYEDKKRNELRKITYEILDSLIVQINIRFEDFPKLEFVEIVNEKMFKSYYTQFPEAKFIKLLQQYPNTFDADRLRNELAVIYANDKIICLLMN
ncbi:uncharacterized protein LOC112688512 [Sipha flava]|uniref:Uncharacterized protein LOC112688512 n=1 Tax=Sipha flava TaxID=143950 RepID=A0A8B8G400_9HEMI|nr:uncharacterized protein LOC112688512 [Sipha flava]XP_025417539.1 uncharacterized protein LOC112688512 [Sipha flava]XP_025417540.1 uncharacterized protein LOC112688512 [Sipha flava]